MCSGSPTLPAPAICRSRSGGNTVPRSPPSASAEADKSSETVLTASFDLDEVSAYRQAWGVFRDRRPDLYFPILSLDGHS